MAIESEHNKGQNTDNSHSPSSSSSIVVNSPIASVPQVTPTQPLSLLPSNNSINTTNSTSQPTASLPTQNSSSATAQFNSSLSTPIPSLPTLPSLSALSSSHSLSLAHPSSTPSSSATTPAITNINLNIPSGNFAHLAGVTASQVPFSSGLDNVINFIFQLRSNVDELTFFTYLTIFRDFTGFKISKATYQEKINQLLPTNLLPLVNKLMSTVVESVLRSPEGMTGLLAGSNPYASSSLPAKLPISRVNPGDMKQKMTSVNHDKSLDYKDKLLIDKKSYRRSEWTPAEDLKFLQGLKTSGLDFQAIQKLLPGRTRLQIRKHYQYLAKAIKDNMQRESTGNSRGPARRIKTRGRTPRSRPTPPPSELIHDLTECIVRLESSDAGRKGRGRPRKTEKQDVETLCFTVHRS